MRRLIKRWLLKNILCAFTYEDVFSVYRNKVVLGDEVMTDDEIRSLIEEIKFIEHTKWWAIVTSTINYKAIKVMTEKSTCWEDMITGKTMLYNLGELKNLNKTIKNYKF